MRTSSVKSESPSEEGGSSPIDNNKVNEGLSQQPSHNCDEDVDSNIDAISEANSNGNNGTGGRSLIRKIRSLFGIRGASSLKESVEEAIEEQEAAGETINPDEKLLLRNVLVFSERTVEDVMVPRADIAWVNYNITLEEMEKELMDNPHTRIPVCRGVLDDVAGFIHIKDVVLNLLRSHRGQQFAIDRVLRQVLFVPPSMKINVLLVKMQLSRVHMALVIDEYGGTCGLVTMEDLVEEIVGDIEDEHDLDDVLEFHCVGPNTYDTNARIDIEILENKLGMSLALEMGDNDFDTLGGLVFVLLGRIPAKGEVATHPAGLEFEVLDADARRVKRVRICKKAIHAASPVV